MVKCAVFFAVRTEFSNIIYTRFGFKGLIYFWWFIVNVSMEVIKINVMAAFVLLSLYKLFGAEMDANRSRK
jgi:hypothetical protein